jgi:Spy/CpxP family protein refolding chaperone
MIFKSACDSYYQQLVEHKKKSALQMFDSLRPEQQAALVQQLQIPDVLPQ